MLHKIPVDHNGFHNGHNNGTYPQIVCESDYEEMPVIDITPSEPQPRWRDQLAPYTHCLQWIDADGCSHSMTLRNDTLEGLLDDLKLIKKGIQVAKAKRAKDDPKPDTVRCEVHNVDMERRISKRTGGSYFSHKLPDNSLCYGKEKR